MGAGKANAVLQMEMNATLLPSNSSLRHTKVRAQQEGLRLLCGVTEQPTWQGLIGSLQSHSMPSLGGGQNQNPILHPSR